VDFKLGANLVVQDGVSIGGSNPSYPGQPAPGIMLWGGNYGKDGSSFLNYPHYEQGSTENPGLGASGTYDVVRLFYQSESDWNNGGPADGDIADMVANNRLAYTSTKLDVGWAAAASGSADSHFDKICARANEVAPSPIWLTLHHEADGGHGVNVDDPAGSEGYVDMCDRFRQRMTANSTTNIALGVTNTSHQFHSQYNGTDREAINWLPSAYGYSWSWDFWGIDHYDLSGNPPGQGLLDGNQQKHVKARDFCAANNFDLVIGEWGTTAQREDYPQYGGASYTGNSVLDGDEAVSEWYDWLLANNVKAACIFDNERWQIDTVPEQYTQWKSYLP